MKIAVTYDNGQIFQHFGRTEAFKIYEVLDDEVKSAVVVDSNGAGHGALAGVLSDASVDVLICGGIGGGAINALEDAGITVVSGASGDTDEVIEKYLNGELVSEGANCNHHDHEDGHVCGDGQGECHCGKKATPAFEGKNVGKTMRVHYTGTFNNGEKFDSSYDRNEPLEFVCGAGMMIKGFDKAVADMEVGEKKDIHLMPEEAYGQPDPNAIFTVEIEQLEGAEQAKVGDEAYLQNSFGQPFRVVVTEKTDTTITFDANHSMAGKELNFSIEVVEIL